MLKSTYTTQELYQSNGIEQNIDGIKQNIDGIKQNIDGIKQNIDGIKQNIDGIKQNIDDMETKLRLTYGQLMVCQTKCTLCVQRVF